MFIAKRSSEASNIPASWMRAWRRMGYRRGIEFLHDLMQRTPNTFRGHVLLAAALKEGVEIQNRAAERLFTGYFLNVCRRQALAIRLFCSAARARIRRDINFEVGRSSTIRNLQGWCTAKNTDARIGRGRCAADHVCRQRLFPEGAARRKSALAGRLSGN